MEKKIAFLIFVVLFIDFSCNKKDEVTTPTQPDQIITSDFDVLSDGKIIATTGFGMGIDDAAQKRNWMQLASASLVMNYPGSLSWGAVFITVGGDPVATNRHWIDISACTRLSIEMKGEAGNEAVIIGIKDKDDPDTGSETRKSVILTSDWKVYEFLLSDFKTCDLKKVYVVTEFVFPGGSSSSAATVSVKSIKIFK